MNLSYKNSKIIKNNDVIVIGKKTLKTSVSKLVQQEVTVVNEALEEEFIKREEEIKLRLIESENRCEEIIKEAQEESFKIIEASKSEALGIEKKAYEQGHSQGLKNGYEDGYKEAYEDNIEKAKLEASEIIQNANDTLFEAKEHVISYMKENKERILELKYKHSRTSFKREI